MNFITTTTYRVGHTLILDKNFDNPYNIHDIKIDKVIKNKYASTLYKCTITYKGGAVVEDASIREEFLKKYFRIKLSDILIDL